MRIFVFAFFLSFSLVASANEELCVEQARSYGDGKGLDHVDAACFDLFKNIADENAKDASSNLEIVGHRNIVFVKDLKSGQVNMLAGQYTEIVDARAVVLNSKTQELLVLDGYGRKILVFKVDILGNVAPVRVVKSPLLDNVADLAYDFERDLILALDPRDGALTVFHGQANALARKNRKKLEPLERVLGDGSNLAGARSIASVNGEVKVFNAQDEQVFNFSLEGISARSEDAKETPKN